MASERSSAFELPKKLEKVLAWLATYYGQHDKQVIQRVLVNSRYEVQEEYSFDHSGSPSAGQAS
jgi:hypothetical protein